MVKERQGKRPARPIRLLIIDDDADIVEVLCMRFRRDPTFVVETALSGAEGVRKARTFLPDVVLLDVVMPHTDGWQVCRTLRADPVTSGARVVAMTAQAGAASPEIVRAAGAHSVLTKPLDLATLTDAVASAAR